MAAMKAPTPRLVNIAPLAALLAFAAIAPAVSASQASGPKRISRCEALAGLKNPDPQAAVEIMLVPVAVKLDSAGNVSSIDHEITTPAAPDGIKRLAADAGYFILKARLTGTAKSAHVAVLDLETAADHPSLLWPAPDAAPDASAVAADGLWHALGAQSADADAAPQIFQATKPYGKEIYKAFAVTDDNDFASLLTAASPVPAKGPKMDTRAPLTPIGVLIKKIFNGDPSLISGPGSRSGPTADAVTVQIVPSN